RGRAVLLPLRGSPFLAGDPDRARPVRGQASGRGLGPAPPARGAGAPGWPASLAAPIAWCWLRSARGVHLMVRPAGRSQHQGECGHLQLGPIVVGDAPLSLALTLRQATCQRLDRRLWRGLRSLPRAAVPAVCPPPSD